MCHALVTKYLWSIMQGIDVRLGFVDSGTIEDVVDPNTSSAALQSYPLLNRFAWMVEMCRHMP